MDSDVIFHHQHHVCIPTYLHPVDGENKYDQFLPHARMREGVKQSVFSVCLSVFLSGEKF